MALAVALATALLLAATMPHMLTEEQEIEEEVMETGAFPILLAFAVGFAIGVVVGATLNDPSNGSGSQEEVNAVLRQSESEKIQFAAEAIRNHVGTVLPSDTSLWAHSQLHWNNAAELAVMGLWQFGREYNPNLTLEQSMMRENVENYMYNWQASLDNFYTHTLIQHIDKWASYDHLSDMTADLVWDSGSVSLFDSVMDFTTLVSNVSRGATIYIDASQVDEGGTYQQSTSGTLYNLSGEDVVLRYVDTGQLVTLRTQNNDMSVLAYDDSSSTIKSGLYRIETEGATIAGPISRAADSAAADPMGALVYTKGSDAVWITSSNGITIVSTPSSISSTESLFIQTGYVDRNGNNATDETYLLGTAAGADNPADLIAEWDGLVQKMNYTIERAAQAGEVLWNIYDLCETSIPYLAPSSMTTSVEGVTLNATQATAMAIMWMQTIATAYNLYGDTLTEAIDQTWSPESLSLYVRGDIYVNGELYAENAVFTPYNSLTAVTFTVNEATVWQNTGFVVYWGQSDDVTGWGGPTNSSEYRLLTMGNGYTIDVHQIGSYGTPLTTATVEPETIERNTSNPSETPDPTTPPTITELFAEWAWILMLLGAAVAGYGLGKGKGWAFVIGLILAGFGLWGFYGFPFPKISLW